MTTAAAITDQDRTRAQVAARFAAKADQPMTACPYKASAGGDTARALAGIWVRAYLQEKGAPAGAVSYDG